MSGQKVTVEIFGSSYTLKSSGDPEILKEVAQFVDSKMKDIESRTSVASSEKIAILAALNIAEEYFSNKREIEGIESDIEEGIQAVNERLEQLL